jgi:REP element-mobilizing transposase RayT
MLARNSIHNPNVELAEPTATHSGRYGYNLHLVLVVAHRFRIGGEKFLARLRERALDLGITFSRMAVMPDHLHMSLRGSPDRSPSELGVAIQNRLAEAAQLKLWLDGFYVGTFSEYTLDTIR